MTLTLTRQTFWGIVGLGGFFLAILLIFGILAPRGAHHVAPLEALQKRFGLDAVNPGLFLILGLIWISLFGLLAFGLLKLIWDIIWSALPITDPGILADDPDKRAELWDWRFGLAKLTALTGVLAAVVALPFTLIRLGLMRSQTEQAADSLFNEKIEAALTSLYATRQITKKVENVDGVEEMRDVHEDDIVRRNAAIDALEGLAGERPPEVIRISRILSVYVRELSRELPIEDVPLNKTPEELREWATSVEKARSDLEAAVQSLGRLRHKFKGSFTQETINLSGANLRRVDLTDSDLSYENLNLHRAQLQGANLNGTQFQWAYLGGAQLQGADLRQAQLQKANLGAAQLQAADLSLAKMQGTNMWGTQLQGANLLAAELQGADFLWTLFDASSSLRAATLRGAALKDIDLTMVPYVPVDLTDVFGDSTVMFPEEIELPQQFNRSYKDYVKFISAWRAFQKEIGFDPDDPSTWDKRKD